MILHLLGGSSAPPASLAAINLNGKRVARVNAPGYQPGYLASVSDKLPGHIRGFREAAEAMPTAAGVPYNWSSPQCSWVDAMAAEPFFGGYVFEPLIHGLMAAQAWNATGEAQARWRLRQLLDHLGSNLKGLITPGNECDNSGAAGSWVEFKQGGVADAVALDRMLMTARITFEERGLLPVAIIGPALAFSTWSGGPGTFTMMDLFSRNGSEFLGYVDGIDTHPHTAACTHWHNFDGSAPADTVISSHHVGRVLNALGITKPWTPFESGYAWDNYETSGLNAKYRFGSHLCGLLRYAVAWWSLYCHAASGHDPMNISEATPPFAKRDWYDAATMISEPAQYMRPDDGNLVITAKPSTEFNLPPWIVCAPHTSTGFPVEFSRVTMTSGNIHCMAGGRNIVARPVWLPGPGFRQVTAHVAVSGGAQAKLCVYGFDKRNMLAESVQPISATGLYGVGFTPRDHGNPLIPDPRYGLVWLDHNGVGTVDWQGVTIT